ncbi:putative phosphatidylinositol phosphate kinase [Acrodontium crateriforme]|uniref:Phosphatidylinositol phosphate kinase n=1 Tax=Acrodontium crateriforme TaxID=150365 RepID=A0AAQ3R508_9PEZI|nr:putative phosphatidylinositol phosphate kinase [Acrodontium crateriforme]
MAPRRQRQIAKSITQSILNSDRKTSFLDRLRAYFHIYTLRYTCVSESTFQSLRATWHVDEESYRQSFQGPNALSTIGDMGYSGSTFFATRNGAWLVKSIPRRFESSFFRDELLQPYVEYVADNPETVLIRIVEFLQGSQISIGLVLGLVPAHQIVMENLRREENERTPAEGEKWESWDLKPMSYFYPERDVAGGALSSKATKSKLADEFNDKLILSRDQAEHFKGQLEKDTALLAKHNAVDYSLFLVRMPASMAPSQGTTETWRNGVHTADGKYVYRAAILDFFWAKHTIHAKAMTGLIKSYNIVDARGPMSVTTEAPEYRERFLKMCRDFIEVSNGGGSFPSE